MRLWYAKLGNQESIILLKFIIHKRVCVSECFLKCELSVSEFSNNDHYVDCCVNKYNQCSRWGKYELHSYRSKIFKKYLNALSLYLQIRNKYVFCFCCCVHTLI